MSENAETKQQDALSLPDYAVGLDSVNTSLQHRTAAYTYLNGVVAALMVAKNNPDEKLPQRLPYVYVKFPRDDGTAGEQSIDMNVIPQESLDPFINLLMEMETEAARNLLRVWKQVFKITDEVKEFVEHAAGQLKI